MQPNEQPQHPIDYLDSIATTPKKPGGAASDKVFFGTIIGSVLVLLFIGVFIFLNGGTSAKDDLTRLSVRLQNLQKVSDDAQKNITSSELRATNTNVSLALANANRDIVEPLKTYDVDPKKIKGAVTSEESTEKLTEKLDDARLNANFDRTYAREMTYELGTLLILIEQTREKTKKSSQKEFLSTLRDNIEPLQKQFDSFGAAN